MTSDPEKDGGQPHDYPPAQPDASGSDTDSDAGHHGKANQSDPNRSEKALSTRASARRNSIPVSPDVFPFDAGPDAAGDRNVQNEDDEAVEEDGEGGMERVSTTRSRALSVVPRRKRRGFLANLALIPEVDNPYDYSRSVKWTITLIVGMGGCAAPMGSAILYPVLGTLSDVFNTSPTIVNLSVALYMLAMSIFPLWWSSFSEILGRRTIYLISFSLGSAFSLASGFSVNITMFIIFRILSGGASASVQAVGAGTIADIWEIRERGKAMGIFYIGPLLGPLLAPLFSGALANAFGWESSMWFMTAFLAMNWLTVLFGLPETLARKKQAAPTAEAQPEPLARDNQEQGPALSRTSTRQSASQAVQERSRNTALFIKRYFLDPIAIVGYLRFPAIACTIYYSAITFGSLYFLNIAMQTAYEQPPYSFNTLIVGILYLPPSLGYIFSSVFGGRWIDNIMHRAAVSAGRYDEQGRLIYLPEDRMRENAWLSATIYPGALIWFGWAAGYGLHWIVPSIAAFFFGAGSMLVFSAVTTMLTEFMPGKSASGVALNNFVRNILACVGSVASQPAIEAIGQGWLFTIIGLWCWVTGNICIWVLRKNSHRWRGKMDETFGNGS